PTRQPTFIRVKVYVWPLVIVRVPSRVKVTDRPEVHTSTIRPFVSKVVSPDVTMASTVYVVPPLVPNVTVPETSCPLITTLVRITGTAPAVLVLLNAATTVPEAVLPFTVQPGGDPKSIVMVASARLTVPQVASSEWSTASIVLALSTALL